MNSLLYLFYWLMLRVKSDGPNWSKVGAMLTFLGLFQLNILAIISCVDFIFGTRIIINSLNDENWFSIRLKMALIYLLAITVLVIYYKVNSERLNDAFDRFKKEDVDTQKKKVKYAKLYLILTIILVFLFSILSGLRKKIIEILFS